MRFQKHVFDKAVPGVRQGLTAFAIYHAIIDDMCGRSALQNAWESIDDETQQEIKTKWVALIEREISKCLTGLSH